MSVNVGQRNIPKTPQVAQCYAVDSAVDLLCHTLRNCKNKVFLNDYKDTVTDKVTATATEIYLSSYKVNECYKSWKAFAPLRSILINCLEEWIDIILTCGGVGHDFKKVKRNSFGTGSA